MGNLIYTDQPVWPTAYLEMIKKERSIIYLSIPINVIISTYIYIYIYIPCKKYKKNYMYIKNF